MHPAIWFLAAAVVGKIFLDEQKKKEAGEPVEEDDARDNAELEEIREQIAALKSDIEKAQKADSSDGKKGKSKGEKELSKLRERLAKLEGADEERRASKRPKTKEGKTEQRAEKNASETD